MQRNDRDIQTRVDETPDTRSYKGYRDTKDTTTYAARETRDMMSQLLMWAVPLLLVGLLGYYLYQAYYSAPAVRAPLTTAGTTAGSKDITGRTVTPVTPVTATAATPSTGTTATV